MILADIGERNCLEAVVKEIKFFGSEAALILALVVGTVLGVGLGWFTFPYLFPLFQNSGLAAWVQAIGSIGAICAAIWISKQSQDRLLAFERARDIDAATRRLEPIVGLINSLDAEIRDAREVVTGSVNADDYYGEGPTRRFELLLIEFDRVSVVDLPTTQLVYAILTVRQKLRSFLPEIEDVEKSYKYDIERYDLVMSVLDRCISQLESDLKLSINCFKAALANTKNGERADFGENDL
jgi:hypothetical protein